MESLRCYINNLILKNTRGVPQLIEIKYTMKDSKNPGVVPLISCSALMKVPLAGGHLTNAFITKAS